MPHDISIVIQSLLLVPLNKELVGGTSTPVLIVAWTLQFEMMFYPAFTLGIINKLAGGFLIALYFLGLSLNLNQLGFLFSFLFSKYILLFLIGMLVAHLVLNESIQN